MGRYNEQQVENVNMREYKKPKVEHLGTLSDLTAGGSAGIQEENNNGNMGTMALDRLT